MTLRLMISTSYQYTRSMVIKDSLTLGAATFQTAYIKQFYALAISGSIMTASLQSSNTTGNKLATFMIDVPSSNQVVAASKDKIFKLDVTDSSDVLYGLMPEVTQTTSYIGILESVGAYLVAKLKFSNPILARVAAVVGASDQQAVIHVDRRLDGHEPQDKQILAL